MASRLHPANAWSRTPRGAAATGRRSNATRRASSTISTRAGSRAIAPSKSTGWCWIATELWTCQPRHGVGRSYRRKRSARHGEPDLSIRGFAVRRRSYRPAKHVSARRQGGSRCDKGIGLAFQPGTEFLNHLATLDDLQPGLAMVHRPVETDDILGIA